MTKEPSGETKSPTELEEVLRTPDSERSSYMNSSKLDLVDDVGNDPTLPYGSGLQSEHDPYVSNHPNI